MKFEAQKDRMGPFLGVPWHWLSTSGFRLPFTQSLIGFRISSLYHQAQSPHACPRPQTPTLSASFEFSILQKVRTS